VNLRYLQNLPKIEFFDVFGTNSTIAKD
jgi:hypothetical protein